MTRRAAVTLAGTVVAALLASMVAVTVHLNALRVPTAAPAPRAQEQVAPLRPIVREVTETITVHRTKKEKAEAPEQIVTVVRSVAPAPVPDSTMPDETEEPGGPPPDKNEDEKGGGEPQPDHDDEDVPGDKF